MPICYAIGGALRDKVSKKRNEKMATCEHKKLDFEEACKGARERLKEEKQESKTRKSSLVLEEEEEEGGRTSEEGVGEETGG